MNQTSTCPADASTDGQVGNQTYPPPAAPKPSSATPSSFHSQELAHQLERLEVTERQTRDRQRQVELTRLRELARYD